VTFSIDSGPIAIAIAIDQAQRRLADVRFAEALWSRRLDVWTQDAAVQKVIGNRLGWLTAADRVSPHIGRLRACPRCTRVRSTGATAMCS
jgi:hypothetical protein